MGDKSNAHKKEAEKIEATMQGIMEFYLSKYFDFYKPKLKKSLRKFNVYSDPELLETYLDQGIDNLKGELSDKFNSIALLILDRVITGRIEELRSFEERFIDLLERTLLKDQNSRPAEVTIIIPDLAGPLDTDKE